MHQQIFIDHQDKDFSTQKGKILEKTCYLNFEQSCTVGGEGESSRRSRNKLLA